MLKGKKKNPSIKETHLGSLLGHFMKISVQLNLLLEILLIITNFCPLPTHFHILLF